jgi:hypothetical protein
MVRVERGDVSVVENQVSLQFLGRCHSTASECDAARQRASSLQEHATCDFGFHLVTFLLVLSAANGEARG